MGVIRVLSDQVANKIAAGEVVERPASVVKELMENALDAGARSIRLEVEGGGKSRIRLTDDGCGMVRDDGLLALERHATSKLRDVDELNAIATLGFRGEALPSMAAVSRLTLETATSTGGSGTRITIAGGKLQQVDEVGLPQGTSVSVANLFFNVPARRKFLKSEATELGHITTLVTHYALAYPEIRFHLETEHRVILSLPSAASYSERLLQIFGQELLKQLIEFRDLAQWPALPDEESSEAASATEAMAGLGVYGFVSRPELQKLNRNSIFVFVNRRLVHDRLLHHAISAAYYNLLPNNVYPAVLLFLDLPYSEVDVNVHPSKIEVRFRRSSFVHDAVRDAIRQALSVARPIPSFIRELDARPTASPVLARPSVFAAVPAAMPAAVRAPATAVVDVGELGISVEDLPPGFTLTPPAPRPKPQDLPWIDPDNETAEIVPQRNELASLRPLGQIHNSFIVAEGEDGLWLIDQHVAHERVLFEHISAQRRAGKVERQGLLMPLVVELDPGRFVAFSDIAPELNAMGFDAEIFGTRSVAIRSAPAGIGADQVERLLSAVLAIAQEEERGTSLEQIRTRIAATIACHAAVKVNMHLEMEKMQWMMRALARTEHPMACPHGRPVLLRYTMEEIQKAFKRIK